MFSGRSKETNPSESTMTTGADLILDAALTQAQQDRFDHEAIAGVVADLTLNATPPVDIALFGPWGSGKSSFFGLLNQRISESDQSVKVARYDAWKYGGRASRSTSSAVSPSNSVSAATSSSKASRTTCSGKSSGAVPSREAGARPRRLEIALCWLRTTPV
jgi:ABC-type transport system involved in cytochrome bd biosynthesis fused ATPase/permease subunit